MRVQLKQVKEERFTWKETLQVSPSDVGEPGAPIFGPVEVEGEVTWVHPGFLFRARLRYDQTLACDRCLEPTLQHVDSEIALVVQVGPVHRHEDEELDEVELEEDDLNVVVIDSEILDTDPLVYEHVLLEVPMKPLCSVGCLGLCPVCGENLALGCGCERRDSDPRWAGLAALKDRLS